MIKTTFSIKMAKSSAIAYSCPLTEQHQHTENAYLFITSAHPTSTFHDLNDGCVLTLFLDYTVFLVPTMPDHQLLIVTTIYSTNSMDLPPFYTTESQILITSKMITYLSSKCAAQKPRQRFA